MGKGKQVSQTNADIYTNLDLIHACFQGCKLPSHNRRLALRNMARGGAAQAYDLKQTKFVNVRVRLGVRCGA